MAPFLVVLEQLRASHEEEVHSLSVENRHLRAQLQEVRSLCVPSSDAKVRISSPRVSTASADDVVIAAAENSHAAGIQNSCSLDSDQSRPSVKAVGIREIVSLDGPLVMEPHRSRNSSKSSVDIKEMLPKATSSAYDFRNTIDSELSVRLQEVPEDACMSSETKWQQTAPSTRSDRDSRHNPATTTLGLTTSLGQSVAHNFSRDTDQPCATIPTTNSTFGATSTLNHALGFLGQSLSEISRSDSQLGSQEYELEPFKLLEAWDAEDSRATRWERSKTKVVQDQNSIKSVKGLVAQDGIGSTAFGSAASGVIRSSSWFGRLICYPGSPKRLVWDITGLLLIIYDITMVPLDVSFGLEGSFVNAMSWLTRLFWTMDMVASLFVGYTHMGTTIMVPKMIAKNYMKTWFIIDVIIVVPDWVLLVLEIKSGEDSQDGGMGDVRQTLKVLRVVRMLRLMRLLKLRRILTEIEDRVNSEHTSIIIDLIKLLACLLALNHLLACGWYLVGDSAVGRNWIQRYNVYDESVPYRYGTCLHWSLTQFTPASIGLEPQNISERIYAICVLLFAMVFFSSFVSSITSSMTHLRMLSEHTSKQMWLLRRFLRERSVPHILVTRILRYLEFAVEQQRHHVQEAKVTITQLLSDQLRDELKCAIALPDLSFHPLFKVIGKLSNITMHRIATTALSRKSLARSDSLFAFGDNASRMYFISSGEMRYTQPGGFRKDLGRGVSLCEPVLWTTWAHLGQLLAVTESDHLALDTNVFSKAVQVNPAAHNVALKYAQTFVNHLNEVSVTHLSDIAYDMLNMQAQQNLSDLVRDSVEGLYEDGAMATIGPSAFLGTAKGRLFGARGSSSVLHQ